MAEGVGFEPTRPFTGPNGFQDRLLRPLGHPSGIALNQVIARGSPSGIEIELTVVAEGVGFEPTKRRQPLTAFRVPRTRPAYATPPETIQLYQWRTMSASTQRQLQQLPHT